MREYSPDVEIALRSGRLMPKKPRGTRDQILRKADRIVEYLQRCSEILHQIDEAAEERSIAVSACVPLLIVSFDQLENLVRGFRKQL